MLYLCVCSQIWHIYIYNFICCINVNINRKFLKENIAQMSNYQQREKISKIGWRSLIIIIKTKINENRSTPKLVFLHGSPFLVANQRIHSCQFKQKQVLLQRILQPTDSPIGLRVLYIARNNFHHLAFLGAQQLLESRALTPSPTRNQEEQAPHSLEDESSECSCLPIILTSDFHSLEVASD